MTAPSHHQRIKALLALIIGASSLAVQIFLPALPTVQAYFDVTAAQVQLAVSVPLLCVALGTMFWGVLSDRYGRRPMLMIGLVVFLVGTLIAMVATDIYVLAVGRVIQAWGGAAGVVIARAIVRDLFGRERAAAVMASLVAVMVIAPMLAPIVGGALVDLLGWRSIFGFVAAFVVLALALSMSMLPETNAKPIAVPGFWSLLGGYGRLLRNYEFCAYAVQSAFLIAVYYVFLSASPHVVMVVMQRSATEYGLFFILSTLGYLGGNLAAHRWSESWGIDRMVQRGLSIVMISTLAMVIAIVAGYWSPFALFLPLVTMGIGNGMALPNSSAGAVSVFPELAGTASGLLSFIQLGISALFAQAAGSIQNGTPYPLVIFMTIASVCAAAAYYGLKSLAATQTTATSSGDA